MGSLVRRGRTADADGTIAIRGVIGPVALAHTAIRSISSIAVIPVIAAKAITRTRLPSTLRLRRPRPSRRRPRLRRRRPRLRRSAVMARFSTVVPASSIVTAAPAGVSRSV